MRVREYQKKDLVALRAIHVAQGFDYALPDLSNPLFLTNLVLIDDDATPGTSLEAPNDKIVGAAILRLTAEAYLLLDPRAGTPRQRWQWLLTLHAAAERDAWQRVSKTSTPGCRHRSQRSSADASRASAGFATTPGRHTANVFENRKASNRVTFLECGTLLPP